MREDINVRQIPGDRKRRWFSSDDLDLIVWLDDDGGFAGFELCYDKRQREHSLVWRPPGGFAHMAVDDGEGQPGRFKATPVLVPNGRLDLERIHAAFSGECAALPAEVATYVLQALESHPDFAARRSPPMEAGNAAS
ncbi:MAG: hypothetical protein FIB06_00235 [Betaproteobacteria bacterium]|nr:hypothetical protein [Betaproteobacteria bacterium]